LTNHPKSVYWEVINLKGRLVMRKLTVFLCLVSLFILPGSMFGQNITVYDYNTGKYHDLQVVNPPPYDTTVYDPYVGRTRMFYEGQKIPERLKNSVSPWDKDRFEYYDDGHGFSAKDVE